MNYNQHLKDCDGEVKYKYKGQIFQLSPTLFEKSVELDIYVSKNDRLYPHFSVFDFECILSKVNLLLNTIIFQYETVYIPPSCSVASSVPNFKTPVCFASKGDPLILMQKVIEYLEQVSSVAIN